MQVSTCTLDVLVLNKTIDNELVTYTFLLQNFFPTDITVSNETIQTSVQEALQQKKPAPNSLTEVIKLVLGVESSTTPITKGSTNTLLALQDFQKINGILINDIAEKDGITLADITIKKVNLIARYDIAKHKIIELYFKNITNENGQYLPVNTFSLTINAANQDNITAFANDPLLYIKNFDTSAWQIYTDNVK